MLLHIYDDTQMMHIKSDQVVWIILGSQPEQRHSSYHRNYFSDQYLTGELCVSFVSYLEKSARDISRAHCILLTVLWYFPRVECQGQAIIGRLDFRLFPAGVRDRLPAMWSITI